MLSTTVNCRNMVTTLPVDDERRVGHGIIEEPVMSVCLLSSLDTFLVLVLFANVNC